MHRINKYFLLVVICVGAGAVLAGRMTAPSIPAADGTITGCYQKNSGQLRVVESGSQCSSAETVLKWKQQGASTSGPAGTAEEAGSHQFECTDTGVEVVSLPLTLTQPSTILAFGNINDSITVGGASARLVAELISGGTVVARREGPDIAIFPDREQPTAVNGPMISNGSVYTAAPGNYTLRLFLGKIAMNCPDAVVLTRQGQLSYQAFPTP